MWAGVWLTWWTCSPCDDKGLHLKVLIRFASSFCVALQISQRDDFLGRCWHEGGKQLFFGDVLSLQIWLWASSALLPSCADQITVTLLFSLSTHRAAEVWCSTNLAFQSAHHSREAVPPLEWLSPIVRRERNSVALGCCAQWLIEMKHHSNSYFSFSAFCMPGIVLGFMISILRMMKWILRNIKWCAPDHIVYQWQFPCSSDSHAFSASPPF